MRGGVASRGPSSARAVLPMNGATMFPSLPHPRHMPCPECGESVAVEERERHACDEERWTTYQLFQLRHEVDAFDDQLATYLESPRGRFELWDAARRRE